MKFGYSTVVKARKCRFCERLSVREKSEKFSLHIYTAIIFLGFPDSSAAVHFKGGDTPLEIYGPKGIEEYIKVSLGISQTRLSYPLKFIELNETDPIFTDQAIFCLCKN